MRGFAPEDLGRRSPPAGWEAYFLIGIFPRNAALRWCKLHVFSGGLHPSRFCLSSIEGMSGAGVRVLFVATSDRVERHAAPLVSGALDGAIDRWRIHTDDLTWDGDFPELSLRLDAPAVHARTSTRDVYWWAKIPRVLSYGTAFGALDWNGARGVALVEHAWGAQSRVDLSPLFARAWHWDVLAFDEGSSCAGLAIDLGGKLRPIASGGSAPGEPFARGRGVAIEWLARDGDVPVRWRGSMRLARGTLVYEARASTPIAPAFDGGGFIGFDFEGELGGRSVAGSGFCEFSARPRRRGA